MDSNGRDIFIGIDANAIVHRAYHAYPQSLMNSEGLQVNAAFGFTVMLLQVLKQFEPKYVMCAFDTAKPTFRHTKFTDYKAHRKPTDKSLLDQFPLVEQIVRSLNIPIIKKEGYEADDILGTISKWREGGKWKSYNYVTYLVTGDKDFLQLVSENTKVCIPQGSFSNLLVFEREGVFEKYGYYPEQVIEYKSMVGDASDNIPGVKGIGEKTALDLLSRYGTLEGIYKNIESVAGKAKMLLEEGSEQAAFSRDLATIHRDVDLDLNLESCLLSDFDENEVIALFTKLEFKSLIAKIPKSKNIQTKGGQMGMFEEKVVEQAALSVNNIQIIVYVNKEESEDEEFLFEVLVDKEGRLSTKIGSGFTKQLDHETWFYDYEDFLVSKMFSEKDFGLFYDIKIFAHMISSGKKSYDISSLVFDYASKNIPEKISKSSVEVVGRALVDVIQALKEKMHKTQKSEYTQKWLDFLRSKYEVSGVTDFELVHNIIDLPLTDVLSKMEKRGILIDTEVLKGLQEEIEKEIRTVTESIFKDLGHEFNLNSPKQLSDVLFTELSLPSNYTRSTREEVLVGLVGLHPIVENILKYREASKILNTYILPFLQTPKLDGEIAIHTDFKMTGSSSGRLASINPNLQNIPARGIWAERIRKAFVPREGFVLVGADYSQIEFRVMADISKDPVLVEDFNLKKDIHLTTASRILAKNESEITKDERNLGKTINFAILFGQTAFGLSRLAKIDTTLAKKYIDDYFKTYSGVAKYIDIATELAKKYGFAQTMFGRTRHIAGLSSSNRNVLSGAIREAVNMPIQGGEADIMRLAMVEVQKMIDEKYSNDAYMLLQIHDELVFEVKESNSEEFAKDVEKIMTSVVTLNVPLEVHVSIGKDMSELK